MKAKPKFTHKQILDFKVYEKVRERGSFNMFDPNARISTGLTKERYAFVMDNYEGLAEAIEGGAK